MPERRASSPLYNARGRGDAFIARIAIFIWLSPRRLLVRRELTCTASERAIACGGVEPNARFCVRGFSRGALFASSRASLRIAGGVPVSVDE
jgi:hypothetical protein